MLRCFVPLQRDPDLLFNGNSPGGGVESLECQGAIFGVTVGVALEILDVGNFAVPVHQSCELVDLTFEHFIERFPNRM